MRKLPLEVALPKLRSQASVQPETLNEEARTVEVIFYSGAPVQRFPFFDDPYELSFDLSAKAVRLERFNAGAPLVDNHRDYGSVGECVLGVVEKAWLSEDGGHARVKIAADRPDIVARLKDGILRNFSMGAVVHQMKDITEKGDPQRRLLAIDWEPHELSIVPVPADPGAQALAQAEKFPCRISNGASAPTEAHAMKIQIRLLADVEDVGKLGEIVEIDESDFDEKLHSKDTKAPASGGDASARANRLAVEEALEADRARAKEIKRLQAHYNLDDVWSQRHIKQNTTIEQVIADATEVRAKNAPIVDGNLSIGDDYESIGWRTDQMAVALSSRMARKAPPEPARQYALSSIAECALECLALNHRTRGRSLDARRNPGQVVELALHTTSDFPLLMANVLNKSLLPDYDLAPQTYRQIAARKEFKDFRPHPFLRAGDFPNLLQVNEHGEFQSGTLSETSESVTAITYGRILGISRQIMVNDDLNAFQDIASNAGRRVAAFENRTFYLLCILPAAGLGPTMSASSGGVAVFNAAHNNITGAGVLSNTLLGSALALMMAQTSLDGIPLNTMPKILLTSPTSYVLAKTLLAALTPNVASSVNPFAGELMAVADANLGTGTRFYVLADPGQLPNYVYGTLEGQSGPRTEVQPGFRIDGLEVKVAVDFGCGAIEFRGGVTGAGA